MENKYCVYIHTFPNKKVYIGITSMKLEKRFKNGYGYKSSPKMYNAIMKYGWDNIKHDILLSKLSKEEAENMEIKFIELCKSRVKEFGYNTLIGGNLGFHDFEYTDEIRKRMSDSHIGKTISNEQRKKISDSNKGRKTWNTGIKSYPCKEETKLKISNSLKGKKHSEERLKNMYEGRKKVLEEGMDYSNRKRQLRVLQIDLNDNIIKEWRCIPDIVEELNMDYGKIYSTCSGYRSKAYGYKWRFVV